MNTNTFLLLLFILMLPSHFSAARAELILNPSFEDNSATSTVRNMTNASANGLIENFTAYGSNSGLMSLYNQSAADGSWWLSAANSQGSRDEFTLHLSESLREGHSYDLKFDWLVGPTNILSSAEIGVSESESMFGIGVFSRVDSGGATRWEEVTTSFVSPVNGAYLSFRPGPPSVTSGRIPTLAIDNISLTAVTAVPEPSLPLFVAFAGTGLLLRRSRRGTMR